MSMKGNPDTKKNNKKTFTEKIPKGKLHFLCSGSFARIAQNSVETVPFHKISTRKLDEITVF